MGPPLFRGGRLACAKEALAELRGFNGAASFQRRKAGAARSSKPIRRPLQWGRLFSEAEGLLNVRQQAANNMLQWGRLFSEAEGDVSSG